MGVFNSVYVKCPDCGYEQEEQYKPGEMRSWEFGVSNDIPLEYLQDFKNRDWECYECGAEFHTDISIEIKVGDQVVSKKEKL